MSSLKNLFEVATRGLTDRVVRCTDEVVAVVAFCCVTGNSAALLPGFWRIVWFGMLEHVPSATAAPSSKGYLQHLPRWRGAHPGSSYYPLQSWLHSPGSMDRSKRSFSIAGSCSNARIILASRSSSANR